jgi:hypothetical protein
VDADAERYVESGVTLPDPLARCLAEQADSRAYLDSDGPDRDGAWRGMEDWVMEECLIRLEGGGRDTRRTA